MLNAAVFLTAFREMLFLWRTLQMSRLGSRKNPVLMAEQWLPASLEGIMGENT